MKIYTKSKPVLVVGTKTVFICHIGGAIEKKDEQIKVALTYANIKRILNQIETVN